MEILIGLNLAGRESSHNLLQGFLFCRTSSIVSKRVRRRLGKRMSVLASEWNGEEEGNQQGSKLFQLRKIDV